jgi:isopentenyl-diphosphate delta-isomerase type 1
MDQVEEYIDVISPDGNLTGISKPRSQVHQEGVWHRSVHIWVLNDNKELLIQRRAFKKENHPGLWDVSCAGHLTSGDSSAEAAVRELKEELGLIVQPEELELIFTIESHYVLNDGMYIDNELVNVYLLRKNVNTKMLILQPGEVESTKLISIDSFRSCISSKNASFVPFWEAYEKFLGYLDKAE